MIIVGDIGNTETKICLVNSKNIIIKRVTLLTKKISHSLLKKSLVGFGLKDKSINKCGREIKMVKICERIVAKVLGSAILK